MAIPCITCNITNPTILVEQEMLTALTVLPTTTIKRSLEEQEEVQSY